MNNRPTKITALLNLFYSLFKSDSEGKEQINYPSTGDENKAVNIGSREQNETDSESSTTSPKVEKDELDLTTSIEERPEIGEKNKWLYPKDGFGKMEHGVVDDESKIAHKKGKKKKMRIIFLD